MKRIFKMLFVIVILSLVAFFEYKDYLINDSDLEYHSSSSIPNYTGVDLIVLNNNEPDFDLNIDINKSFESYGKLDNLGRCSSAYGNLGYDLMPTTPRERIRLKPVGFKIVKYSIIDDELLYNRCHLIAYQLTGELENRNNLITCTRHMNAVLMEPYESKVGNYIRKTKNHVLYRVTPIYEGDNIISKGVQMEALSLEDNGEGIKFNIFIYNVQPGILIDYKSGDSKLLE